MIGRNRTGRKPERKTERFNLAEEFSHFGYRRCEGIEADHQHRTIPTQLCNGGGNGLKLFRVYAEGLLHKDVLAGPHRPDDHLSMQVVPGGNTNGLRFFVAENLLKSAVVNSYPAARPVCSAFISFALQMPCQDMPGRALSFGTMIRRAKFPTPTRLTPKSPLPFLSGASSIRLAGASLETGYCKLTPRTVLLTLGDQFVGTGGVFDLEAVCGQRCVGNLPAPIISTTACILRWAVHRA